MEGKCKFPLLADRSGKICKKYGVFDPEEGVARKALVVVDPTGTARHMVATSLTMDRLIDDTLKALATFQGKVREDTKKVYLISPPLLGLPPPSPMIFIFFNIQIKENKKVHFPWISTQY